MAQSDARFGYRANLNRESFNLGRSFGFTAAPGMLLPVFEDIATPGDSYYIQHDLTFLRTLPLAAPAMCDVLVHYESFFVPLQMLFQPIEQALFSITDVQSAMFLDYNLRNNSLPLAEGSWIKSDFKATDHDIYHSDAFRMLDMFGMNADALARDSNNPARYDFLPNFFPWQILAYNAIWQYFYRLDDKSDFSNACFNIDDKYADATFHLLSDAFIIQQRAWDFDYFTSAYRSPIVSNASMQQVMSGGVFSNLVTGESTIPIDDLGNEVTQNSSARAFSGGAPSSYLGRVIQGSYSTAMIRQMFANEKLAMITGRARKTYDSQVLAHFGIEVPHDPKHDIALIGSDTYPIHIGEVTSLASSSTAGLGDLAGKGWTQGQGKKHKFVAPCHGVVMTIFSVEPKKRYYGGYDRINAIQSAFEIPTPEYDRLGNMPMFRYETGERSGEGTVTDFDIVNWKERYYYSKRQHDKVTLAFMNPKSSSDTYNNLSSYMITSAPYGAYTSTNNHTARPDLPSRYYIDRNCLDGLMLTPYIGKWQTGATGEETSENWNKTPWLVYARDPFIVDSDVKVTKVSWMSKDGEPISNF